MKQRTKRRPAKHKAAHHKTHVKKAKPRRHRLHRPPKRSRPTGPTTPQSLLTEPMVDRLFWRAGFGPTAQDRATWTGKPLVGSGQLAALDARRALGRPGHQ